MTDGKKKNNKQTDFIAVKEATGLYDQPQVCTDSPSSCRLSGHCVKTVWDCSGWLPVLPSGHLLYSSYSSEHEYWVWSWTSAVAPLPDLWLDRLLNFKASKTQPRHAGVDWRVRRPDLTLTLTTVNDILKKGLSYANTAKFWFLQSSGRFCALPKDAEARWRFARRETHMNRQRCVHTMPNCPLWQTQTNAEIAVRSTRQVIRSSAMQVPPPTHAHMHTPTHTDTSFPTVCCLSIFIIHTFQ